MAYTKATRNRSTITPRTGSKSANVQLSIATPDGDYLCESSKGYTDKASVIQELDNNDAFITLSSFSKNLAALTVHNAKALVIKNVGITALEISLRHPDWRNDGGSDGASDTTTTRLGPKGPSFGKQLLGAGLQLGGAFLGGAGGAMGG